MPVRLLDTSDLVKYLAEQRSNRKASRITKSICPYDLSKPASHAIIEEERSPGAALIRKIKHHFRVTRKKITFLIVVLVIIGLAATTLLMTTLRQSIEAVVRSSHIEWDFIRLDEFTPNTLHIFAIGRIAIPKMYGILETSEFDMLNPTDSGGPIGKLQLPDVVLGHTTDNSFSVDQSIILQDKAANLQFFANLGRASARVLLQGSGTIRWRSLRAPVRLNRIESQLTGLQGSIKYSNDNSFHLASSIQNDAITFESNLTIRNLSPFSVRYFSPV